MTEIQRNDPGTDGPDVSYPAVADRRGSARLRRSLPQRVDSIEEETNEKAVMSDVYLGPHNSPYSYVIYGLWLHIYKEHGKNINPQKLKQQALDAMNPKPASLYRKIYPYLLSIVSAIALVSAPCAIVLFVKFPSSDTPPVVDDLALSEDEAKLLQGLRDGKGRVSMKPAFPAVDAETVRQIMEGKHGPIHKIRKEP